MAAKKRITQCESCAYYDYDEEMDAYICLVNFDEDEMASVYGEDYRIADPELACVTSAKWQLAMMELLLKDGGMRAKEIKESFVPEFVSARAYLDYTAGLFSSGDRIVYREDGAAEVKDCCAGTEVKGCNL